MVERRATPTDKRILAAADNSDSLSIYLEEISRTPLLTLGQEQKLAKRISKGDQAAEVLMIQANLRLVVSIAKKYRGRGVSFEDLLQEGGMGLMKAVKKFDLERGYKFSTYATWWIRQKVQRVVAVQSRTIRMPGHADTRARKIHVSIDRLRQTLNREPTDEEIAQENSLSLTATRLLLDMSRDPLSLDTPVNKDGDEDTSVGDFIVDKAALSPETEAIYSNLKGKIAEVLATLPAREARILRLRFGLQNEISHTLEEVGKKEGLTRERVRQIEAKAISRLRHPGQSKNLRDLIEY